MSRLSKIQWDIDMVAQSSIVHREVITAASGNFALFRREKNITPDNIALQVPMVSGGGFRGALRRIGEELTAEALDYEDAALPVPAAHLLTNGGRLAKSKTPLDNEGIRHLRNLLPLVAVFGGAASGRIMSGLLHVGKVVPEVAENVHILDRPPQSAPLPAVRALGAEWFGHLADHRTNFDRAPCTDLDEKSSPLTRFGVETLPAGTRLQTWVLLKNATSYQAAFMRDVLDAFASYGHLGGRASAGHGRVIVNLSHQVKRGQFPDEAVDWRAELKTHRDEAIAALSNLS